MTQFGKCDVCRLRKVKCDETRPKCRACMKKGRDCTYSFSPGTRFISEGVFDTRGTTKQTKDTLLPSRLTSQDPGRRQHRTYKPSLYSEIDLRIRREAPCETGIFYVFPISSTPRRQITSLATATPRGISPAPILDSRSSASPEPSRPPSCDSTRLASRWISMLGASPERSPLRIFGDWITLVPARVGHCHALDSAVVSLIDGLIAFLLPDEKWAHVAEDSIALALRDLRLSLQSPDMQYEDVDLALAGIILLFVEIFMGVRNFRYIPHIDGLTRILIRNGPTVLTNKVMRNVFFSNLQMEFFEAILDGNDCFDDPLWLDYPNLDMLNDDEHAFISVARQMVRIPRLMRLVRRLLQVPTDEDVRSEVIELVENLLLNRIEVETRISSILESAVHVHPTKSEEIAALVPQSFAFDSVEHLQLCLWDWLSRMLICGLLQSLNTLFPDSPLVDPGFLERDDIQAAECIAMSAQWTKGLDPRLSLVELRHLVPMQISFGAWHRLEKREAMTASAEWHRARKMKDWVFSNTQQTTQKWRCQLNDFQTLELKMEVFAGAPLPPWMGRRKPVKL